MAGLGFKPMAMGSLAQRGDILAPILSHLSPAAAGPAVLALVSSSQGWWGSSCGPSISSTCKPSVSPFAWEWGAETPYSQLCHLCRAITQSITSGSPGLSFIWLSWQEAQGTFVYLLRSHLSAVCNSVREETLPSSWETRAKWDQGHTEACTSGCFTPGPSAGWRLPHRAKSSRRPLSPWGSWGTWSPSPELSKEDLSVQAVQGLLTHMRWEVGQSWAWLGLCPLPAVWSQATY